MSEFLAQVRWLMRINAPPALPVAPAPRETAKRMLADARRQLRRYAVAEPPAADEPARPIPVQARRKEVG